mgnify:CR=1 FL=1
MRKFLRKYILGLIILTVFSATSCQMAEYVELKQPETEPLVTIDAGYVSKEVISTPTIDFNEVFNESEETVEEVEVIEGVDTATYSELLMVDETEVITSADTEIDIEAIEAMGLGSQTTEEAAEVEETAEVKETASQKDDKVYDGELNVMNYLGNWKYGRTPCEWIFVEPNTQLISNYRPNSSVKYSINSRVSSGEKGCYIPIFIETEMKGDGFDARFYVYDDYTKGKPDDMLFSNTLDSLTYQGKTIEEILMSSKKLSKTKNGILVDHNNYINIVYVTDLDKILASK